MEITATVAEVEDARREAGLRRLLWRSVTPWSGPGARCPKEATPGEPCSCEAWQGEERLFGHWVAHPDPDGGLFDRCCCLVPLGMSVLCPRCGRPTQEPA